MVVFGGRGPTPWRGPSLLKPQVNLKPTRPQDQIHLQQIQAQPPPHQSGWPGQTTSVSGEILSIC